HDRMFMFKVSQAGAAEIKFAELARTKATAGSVRDFANMMITDHSKANKELMDLATQKHVALAYHMDKAHVAVFGRLSKSKGRAFDSAFSKAMQDDHKSAVAAFKAESRSAKDADLKSWVIATLPTLQHHLQMAEGLPAGGSVAMKHRTRRP